MGPWWRNTMLTAEMKHAIADCKGDWGTLEGQELVAALTAERDALRTELAEGTNDPTRRAELTERLRVVTLALRAEEAARDRTRRDLLTGIGRLRPDTSREIAAWQKVVVVLLWAVAAWCLWAGSRPGGWE
jgi:hypothetical protein